MKVALYQGRFPVGAIEENAVKILAVTAQAKAQGAEILFFPELALSGYPPEDLLFQADFKAQIQAVFEKLMQELPLGIIIGFGMPWYENEKIYNAFLVLAQGKILQVYRKQELPNFGVFDERRYFSAGELPGLFEYQGQRIGLLICEDLWHETPLQALQQQKLDLLVSIHASPFEAGKQAQRIAIAQKAQAVVQVPLLYVHQVGVQDELIFDGGSFYLNQQGDIEQWPQFKEGLFFCDSATCHKNPTLQDDEAAEIYQALCFALKGYVDHHRFPGVLIGLSGGIDSALVLAIAADALGPECVEAILMPSQYTAAMSIEDAAAEANALAVSHQIISIESLFQSFLLEVSPHFIKPEWDLTEENIQARLRGMILMALSNKSGKMVVSTTNKSELAVGYGTLYGDMVGGFALLKDVYKTQVYELAKYRNSLSPVIPERVITRAPSAELRENQTDQDSLPDYALLDQVLQLYLEENRSVSEIKKILKQGVEVDQVVKLIRRNEYKRTQAPIGAKVSRRAFGKEWRMPIMGVW